MNTKNLIVTVATVLVTSFGASAAMAQEATIETPVVQKHQRRHASSGAR